MKSDPLIPVNSSNTSSVISTSNLPPKSLKPAALARTGKTDKLPRLSNQKTKMESDEDSSSSSPRQSSTSSSHKQGDAEAIRKVAKLKKMGF
jgi:hypothetical protein